MTVSIRENIAQQVGKEMNEKSIEEDSLCIHEIVYTYVLVYLNFFLFLLVISHTMPPPPRLLFHMSWAFSHKNQFLIFLFLFVSGTRYLLWMSTLLAFNLNWMEIVRNLLNDELLWEVAFLFVKFFAKKCALNPHIQQFPYSKYFHLICCSQIKDTWKKIIFISVHSSNCEYICRQLKCHTRKSKTVWCGKAKWNGHYMWLSNYDEVISIRHCHENF